MDQDGLFMSSLLIIYLRNIIFKTVVPYNLQSLQAEHGINLYLLY